MNPFLLLRVQHEVEAGQPLIIEKYIAKQSYKTKKKTPHEKMI